MAAIAVPELRAQRTRARVHAAATEARELYRLFQEHRNRYGTYHPELAPDTLQPLRAQGYAGTILRLLEGGRIDGFDSPDDQGPDREFWIEMTLADDPEVRLVVADSDDAPLGAGIWLDGVYRFRDGVLSPL